MELTTTEASDTNTSKGRGIAGLDNILVKQVECSIIHKSGYLHLQLFHLVLAGYKVGWEGDKDLLRHPDIYAFSIYFRQHLSRT